MPFIDQVSDSDLRVLALEQVVPALLTRGFCAVDGLLGPVAGGAVLEQVRDLHRAGALQDGRLASPRPGLQGRSVRGDQICWVSGSERGCEAVGFLLCLLDRLVALCAQRLGAAGAGTGTGTGTGTGAGTSIRERSKAMVACYPGNGAGYVKHVDNHNCDGRRITCIYYLNRDWDQAHGGVLRLFPRGKPYVADVKPLFDRLLLFWSDRRNPHQVQPSYATRYAVTVWYFDSEERAEAKRRFRDLTASASQRRADGSSS